MLNSLLRSSQFSIIILLLLINSVLAAILSQPSSAKVQVLRHGHKRTLNRLSSHHAKHSRQYRKVIAAPGKEHLSRRHSRKRLVTRYHRKHRVTRTARAPKPRYAYPISLFMARPPAIELDPLPGEIAAKINDAFEQGTADALPAKALVRAGVVRYHPLRGGIFYRREPVKYIIIHSTETGIPLGAVRVIESWSSGGLRHAGAQYVIERDGTIYQSVDPELATVHVNIFKTLPGINNDNSIGIEMCHTGQQDYPVKLTQSVIRLVSYLQQRYNVPDENVITHRYAQQGDHTDPVNFDWQGFLAQKNMFMSKALAIKAKESINTLSDQMPQVIEPSAYLQPHPKLESPASDKEQVNSSSSSTPPSLTTKSQLSIQDSNSPGKAPYRQDGSISRSLPTLRGPIEMEPNTAKFLSKEEGSATNPSGTIGSAPVLPQKPDNASPSPEIEFVIHQQ